MRSARIRIALIGASRTSRPCSLSKGSSSSPSCCSSRRFRGELRRRTCAKTRETRQDLCVEFAAVRLTRDREGLRESPSDERRAGPSSRTLAVVAIEQVEGSSPGVPVCAFSRRGRRIVSMRCSSSSASSANSCIQSVARFFPRLVSCAGPESACRRGRVERDGRRASFPEARRAPRATRPSSSCKPSRITTRSALSVT